MRLMPPAATATLALGLWIGADARSVAIAAPITDPPIPLAPAPFPPAIGAAPLEIHPGLHKPRRVTKKVRKPSRLKRLKRSWRKRQNLIRKRRLARHPPPPRRPLVSMTTIARPSPPSRPKSFEGAYAGIALGLEQTEPAEISPYGALVPVSVHPTPARKRILTLKSFAGINKDFAPFLAGIEADIGYAFNLAKPPSSPYGTLTPTGLEASLRGRLGAILDGVLLYGTGGLALANVTKSFPDFHYDTIHAGWTIGAGIETFLTPALLLRAEYLYRRFPDLQLGSHTLIAGFAIKF